MPVIKFGYIYSGNVHFGPGSIFSLSLMLCILPESCNCPCLHINVRFIMIQKLNNRKRLKQEKVYLREFFVCLYVILVRFTY